MIENIFLILLFLSIASIGTVFAIKYLRLMEEYNELMHLCEERRKEIMKIARQKTEQFHKNIDNSE